MKICPNCGSQNPKENQVCQQCQTVLIPPDSSIESTANTPKHKKKIVKIVVAIIAIIVIFLVLKFTHIICFNHNWNAATCIEPAQCTYCDKYKDDVLGNHKWMDASCTSPKTCFWCDLENGEPLGHDWSASTCTEPATCKNCGKTSGEAVSHTEGDWVVVEQPTFNKNGEESLFCSVCNETLDNRSIDKKVPAVVGKTFNFTDEELIDWLNDIAKFDIGHTNVESSSNMNTMYLVSYDGETGGLILNHNENDKDGNVRAIMIYFEEWATSVVIAAWIGEQISSDFSADEAFSPIASGKSYTAGDMTLVDVDDIIALTPSETLAQILA